MKHLTLQVVMLQDLNLKIIIAALKELVDFFSHFPAKT